MKTKTIRKWLIFWCLFIGIGAYAGAAMMFVSPDGSMFGMAPILPYLRKLPLPGFFFNDFIWPGIALLVINGLTNTFSYILLMKRSKYGALAGGICGIILMLWITVQFTVFEFNFMSTAYCIFGILKAGTGFCRYKREKSQR